MTFAAVPHHTPLQVDERGQPSGEGNGRFKLSPCNIEIGYRPSGLNRPAGDGGFVHMAKATKRAACAQAAWRASDFEAALGLSHTTISDMLTGGEIKSVLISPRLRLATESPTQYLARKAAEATAAEASA